MLVLGRRQCAKCTSLAQKNYSNMLVCRFNQHISLGQSVEIAIAAKLLQNQDQLVGLFILTAVRPDPCSTLHKSVASSDSPQQIRRASRSWKQEALRCVGETKYRMYIRQCQNVQTVAVK